MENAASAEVQQETTENAKYSLLWRDTDLGVTRSAAFQVTRARTLSGETSPHSARNPPCFSMMTFCLT
jgi:hypothetical protein